MESKYVVLAVMYSEIMDLEQMAKTGKAKYSMTLATSVLNGFYLFLLQHSFLRAD